VSTWDKDWDNPDDAVYDTPDEEQIAAAAKRKAMLEYMDWSLEVEDAIIKSIGQAEYYASEHWINNPLIKPQSKVYLFEQWEERIRKEQNECIIKLLEKDLAINSKKWADAEMEWGLYRAIELIKEEANE
jgi:hypothetical protein